MLPYRIATSIDMFNPTQVSSTPLTSPRRPTSRPSSISTTRSGISARWRSGPASWSTTPIHTDNYDVAAMLLRGKEKGDEHDGNTQIHKMSTEMINSEIVLSILPIISKECKCTRDLARVLPETACAFSPTPARWWGGDRPSRSGRRCARCGSAPGRGATCARGTAPPPCTLSWRKPTHSKHVLQEF